MKVKLLVPRVGINGAETIGDEIDVSAEEGARLIEKHHAEPVRAAKPETATKKKTAEKASK